MAPKIQTPVKGFSGQVAGVHFIDGLGETENPAALAYFERQGYPIGEASETGKTDGGAPATGAANDSDLDELSSKALKIRAKDRGVSPSGSKEAIIERIRAKNAEVTAKLEEHNANSEAAEGGDDDEKNDGESTEGDNPEGKPAEVSGSSEHGSVREVGE